MTEGRLPKIDDEGMYASEYNGFFWAYSDCKCYNLAVSNTNNSIDLSSINYKYSIMIRNIGTADCYFDLDNTATTSNQFLPAGSEIIIQNCSFDYISAITSLGTTTLSIAIFISTNNKTGYKTNKEILTLSVTDSSGNVSFTNTTLYKDVLVTNAGVNNVYINFGSTATTGGLLLKPAQSLYLMTNKYQISAICNTGLTSIIRILGVY